MNDFEKELVGLVKELITKLEEMDMDVSDYEIMLSMLMATHGK